MRVRKHLEIDIALFFSPEWHLMGDRRTADGGTTFTTKSNPCKFGFREFAGITDKPHLPPRLLAQTNGISRVEQPVGHSVLFAKERYGFPRFLFRV